MPVAEGYVIECESSLVKLNFNLLFFAGLEEDLLEALEFLLRAENSAAGLGNIELRRLSAVNGTDVLDFEAHCHLVAILDIVG